jgi:MFS family permease
MPDTPSAFAPFRSRAFRTLWLATLASNLGTLVQGVGAGWMMTSLSGSDDMVALVQASNTLPIMGLALLAGAMADNYDRRSVMLAAQCFMCAVSVALAVAAWAGVLGSWSLLAFTLLIGCGQAMHLPSWQSSMRDLVPRQDLQAAVALNSMSFNSMRSVGPAVGGLIVASFGPAAAFTLNAVSYLAVIAALLTWPPRPDDRTLPREGLAAAMAAGVRYVAMSPNLMATLTRSAAFGVSVISALALGPLIARDLLGGTAVTYGLLLGAFGLGGIGGALLSGKLRRRLRTETIVRGSFLCFAAGVVLTALSRNLPLTLAGMLLMGGAWVQALSLFNVSVQLATPRWVVGRALSLYQTVTFGSMALGSWLWGSVSDQIGPANALIMSGAAAILGAGIGLIRAVPEFASMDLDPLNRFSEPSLKLDLRGRSGPIAVTVEWTIPAASTDAFLATMVARRRVRLRDGARRWVLLRDLEAPETWTESYHVPTWTEYVRHNQRRTKADAEITDRLIELNGGKPPLVRRMIERQAVPLHDDMPILQHPKVL